MSAAPDRAEELFTEHSSRIYAYCLRQLGSREEAEDAVQATYLNACRSLLQGFEPDVAQAWLFKVAQNVCRTRQRSSWRRRRVEQPEDIQEIEELIPSPHEPGDDLLGIADALASLSEQQRRAILLREWKGLSYSEVAAEMGLTQVAVETLIFRARRSLAAALEAPEATRRRRPRWAHAFDPGALVASLKTAVSGGLSTTVTTGLAVAVSATAVTTGQPGGLAWPKSAWSAPVRTASAVAAEPTVGKAVSSAGRDRVAGVGEHSKRAHREGWGHDQEADHARASGRREPPPAVAERKSHGEGADASEHGQGEHGRHGPQSDHRNGEKNGGGHGKDRGGKGHAYGKSKDKGHSHSGED